MQNQDRVFEFAVVQCATYYATFIVDSDANGIVIIFSIVVTSEQK